jgi:hypothetical protein
VKNPEKHLKQTADCAEKMPFLLQRKKVRNKAWQQSETILAEKHFLFKAGSRSSSTLTWAGACPQPYHQLPESVATGEEDL